MCLWQVGIVADTTQHVSVVSVMPCLLKQSFWNSPSSIHIPQRIETQYPNLSLHWNSHIHRENTFLMVQRCPHNNKPFRLPSQSTHPCCFFSSTHHHFHIPYVIPWILNILCTYINFILKIIAHINCTEQISKRKKH